MKIQILTHTRFRKNTLLIAAASSLLVVPVHAVIVDLTTAGASGMINGANFVQVPDQSTGTGVINSFVRVQANGTQEGYNATARPVMPDVNTSPTFTRDIQLSAVPIVSGNYQFLLDVNQTGANPFISLDQLKIYTRPSALATANTVPALTAAPSVLRYDLDGGGVDSYIKLDFSLNSGSGSGDMFAYIPVAAFGTAAQTDFVYLYSQFGTNFATNDGFEEWATLTPAGNTPGNTPGVPDGGATILLLGGALLTLAMIRRRIAA